MHVESYAGRQVEISAGRQVDRARQAGRELGRRLVES